MMDGVLLSERKSDVLYMCIKCCKCLSRYCLVILAISTARIQPNGCRRIIPLRDIRQSGRYCSDKPRHHIRKLNPLDVVGQKALGLPLLCNRQKSQNIAQLQPAEKSLIPKCSCFDRQSSIANIQQTGFLLCGGADCEIYRAIILQNSTIYADIF